MIVLFVPTEIGTIGMLALLPHDIETLMEDNELPLIELEETMRRGIPLPKFLKIFPVRDQDELNEVMNRWLANAGSESTMDDFSEFESLPTLYEKDEEEGE